MYKLIFVVSILILGQAEAKEALIDPYYGGYSIVFKCELPNSKIIEVVSLDTVYGKYYDSTLGRELNVLFDDNKTLKCSFKTCKGK